MQFTVSKQAFVNILENVKIVATKHIREDLEANNKSKLVTINVQPDKLIFITTNGFLDAQFELPIEGQTQEGSVTLDADVLFKVAKSLGGSGNVDRIFEGSIKEEKFQLTDTLSKSKKNFATIETYPENLAFKFVKVQKPIFEYKFENEEFRKVVKGVGSYAAKTGYNPRFQQILIHASENKLNYVAGDGMRFAVMEKDKSTGYTGKFYLPQNQSEIVAEIAEDQEVLVVYKDARTCFVHLQDGTQLIIKGICEDAYIAYEKHAFQVDKAINVLDITRKELNDGCNLVASVFDKGAEDYQTVKLEASDEGLNFEVKEGKYNCEYACPGSFYKLGEREKFSSKYASAFLQDVSRSSNESKFVRIYCLDENGTIIIELLDLLDGKDDNGFPLRKNSDRLLFFFSSVQE